MRLLAPVAVALCAAAATLPAVPAAASVPPPAATVAPQGGPRLVADDAERVLTEAATLLERDAPAERPERPVRVAPEHATFVMRDLFESIGELDGEDRRLAEMLLARPTDGAADPHGNGYTTASVRRCARTTCLHWVPTTEDAPPSAAWAAKSLRVLQKVWDYEVGRLGYRRPVADAGVGGNSKFDVYLKDLGAGLYGYCAPEYYKPGSRRVASAYCVIDDDFARSQFEGTPGRNLRVTLAHEFFHAVQFAYDIADDRWLYESTAAWMEERFADGVDDNRQYLARGQVRRTHVPLDTYDGSSAHYGNWAWWEFLSQRFGTRVVREVWEHVDANRGAPNQYSTRAMRTALRGRGGFSALYRAFANGNNAPAATYAEGRGWPTAKPSGWALLGGEQRAAAFVRKVDHMASRSFVLRPAPSVGGGSRLKVTVNGPGRGSAPGAALLLRRTDGTVERRAIDLTRKGFGRAWVPMGRVRRVVVTVANTSTAFDCRQGTTYTCHGRPLHDDRVFRVRARLVR